MDFGSIIILIIGLPFMYFLFFKCPQKDGSRTKCRKCGSTKTKSQGPDYSTAHKGGKVNHVVKCLNCGHTYIAMGAHDSKWV